MTIRLSPASFPDLSPKCGGCFRPKKFAPNLRDSSASRERDAESGDPDEEEVFSESPAMAAERVRQFATIKELLIADMLGTS